MCCVSLFWLRLESCQKGKCFYYHMLKFSSLFPVAGLAACHEKRGPHEAPGKSVKSSGNKMCPYSHPSSQNTNGSSAGNSLSTSADLCKTTSKHYKTMCRRPTPPGNTSLAQLLTCSSNVHISHFLFFFFSFFFLTIVFISIITGFLIVYSVLFF